MLKLNVRNINNEEVSKVEVPEDVFDYPLREHLVYEAVKNFRANQRSGNATTKTRGNITGSGKKLWKQKGTGRARAGTIRSPLWRSGGQTFAAKPQDHSQKVNRKMYRGALQAILSELVRQERLVVLDSFDLAAPKTTELLGLLAKHGVERGLIVTADVSENLFLASLNIPNIYVLDVASLDPVSLVGADKVIMTVDAVKKIEEWLG